MGGDRKRFKLSPQSKEYCEPDSSHNLLSALRDSQTSSSERVVKSPLFDLQAWVSDTHVVVGTKCNKLVCVNAVTQQMHDIILPPKPVRSEELLMASNNHPGCGIHTMAVSPDGSMLAVGGADPMDCQIMHIQHQHGKAPIFTPMQALVGHRDWLFGVTWLTDRHIVTGSRDHSIKLWRNDEANGTANYRPLESRTDHRTKVRDVKYCRDILKLASLGADGTVKLWDPNLSPVHSMKLLHDKELVCMAMTANLVAVGSQSHVSLLDPRIAQPTIRALDSIDPGQGVRSLGIMDNILSSGSGRGRIAFFDLRANDYISVQPEALSRPQSLAMLLFPEKLGGITETGASAPGQRFAQQNFGIIIMVVGYFYFAAGRNNAEWFFAGSILDRMVASMLAFFLFVTGSATLAQVAGQVAVDVGSAIYTYKLYQEDLADRQLQRRQ
ncbi:MAG: hypothetical protein FRX49_13433 [Trebouxia sp. A1-2]|nr:MAG: hypothetical protein FRX49_13433 [Trebouxia sp. A1-2]